MLTDSLQPDRFLLTYRSVYSARIMDLPLSSFVSHFFLLAAPKVSIHGSSMACLCLKTLIICIYWTDCRDASPIVLC